MDEKISGSFLNGNMVGLYVLFRDGPKEADTLYFDLDNGDHINVDVDDHGEPIGVEIVYMEPHGNDNGIFKCGKDNKVKKEAIVRRLLAASTRLTMIRMMQESLAEEVNTCLEVIRHRGMYSTTGIDTTGDKPKAIHNEADDTPKSHAASFFLESAKINRGKQK